MVDQNTTKRKWKTFKTSSISIMVKRRFCILRSKNKSFRYLESESEHHLVVSDFLWPYGLYSPWNSLGLWKILKEMGIPDHLICLLRNLYAGQESTVRTGHGTTDWFQMEKEYVKTVYCHPSYLTYMQSTSWEMLGLGLQCNWGRL